MNTPNAHQRNVSVLFLLTLYGIYNSQTHGIRQYRIITPLHISFKIETLGSFVSLQAGIYFKAKST